MYGVLRGILLIGASAVAVLAFWGVVEQGSRIAQMGPPPLTAARLPIEQPPPLLPAARPPLPLQRRAPPVPSNPIDKSAAIYKWTDEKGGIHFSDQPHDPGSQMISVAAVQTVDMPAPQRSGFVGSAGVTRRRQHDNLISADDYKITRDVSHHGSALVLNGRIESGPDCSALRLWARAQSNHGRRVSGTTVVNNVGSISRLWEIHAGSAPSGSSWEIVEVRASCLD